MGEELIQEEIITYGQRLFYQLESLIKVGMIDGDADNRVFDLSSVAEVLLAGIKDNLEKLISMIEEKFGNLKVVVRKDDELIKPIKIEIGGRT